MVCPKGGGFDTKMLGFHFENLQFLVESLLPFHHHLVKPSVTWDILEVREGPQAPNCGQPEIPPCILQGREAPMVLPQVLLCGLSAEDRLVSKPKKKTNPKLIFNFS